MAGLEDEALEILWCMVTEEGHARALINLDHKRMQLMIKNHAAFSSLLNFGEIPISSNVMDAPMLIKKSEREHDAIEKEKLETCIERALTSKDNLEQVQVKVFSLCSAPNTGNGDQSSKKFIVLVHANQKLSRI